MGLSGGQSLAEYETGCRVNLMGPTAGVEVLAEKAVHKAAALPTMLVVERERKARLDVVEQSG